MPTLGTDAYCEAADVQARFGQRTFSSTSKPTTTEVGEFIYQGFELINGVLTTVGYTVPVNPTTYPKAGRILRALNADFAAAQAHAAAFAAGAGGVPEQASWLMGLFNDRVKLFAAGKLSLQDAPAGGDKIREENAADPEGEFDLDSDGDERDSQFTRDMDL